MNPKNAGFHSHPMICHRSKHSLAQRSRVFWAKLMDKAAGEKKTPIMKKSSCLDKVLSIIHSSNLSFEASTQKVTSTPGGQWPCFKAKHSMEGVLTGQKIITTSHSKLRSLYFYHDSTSLSCLAKKTSKALNPSSKKKEKKGQSHLEPVAQRQ